MSGFSFGGGFGSNTANTSSTPAFGASTSTPAFGGFGQPAQPQQQQAQQPGAFGSGGGAFGGGGFGASSSTPAFGASTSTFGGGGGLFGSAAQKPASGFSFGQQPSTTSTFGAPAATPAFGAPATSTFGGGGAFGAAAPAQEVKGTDPFDVATRPEDPKAEHRNGRWVTPGTNNPAEVLKFHSITVEPKFQPYSSEELRLMDYARGVKNSSQAPAGTTTFGGFGATPATGTGFGGFGSSTPAAGGFGAGASTSAFGQPASGTGAFGQPATGGGLFGQSQQQQQPSTPFGQTSTTTGGGLFGQQQQQQPATGGGLFGQPAQQQSAPFGQPAAGTSAFGAAKPGGLFGSSTSTPFGGASTSTFGQPAQQTGAFGQPAQQTNAFGAPASQPSTGFSFGAPASSAPATNAFGAPAGGGLFGGAKPFGAATATSSPFGAPATSQPAATGGFGASTGGFGSSTTGGFGSGGGLFGANNQQQNQQQQQQQPATGGGLFGGFGAAKPAAPAAPSFGGFGASTSQPAGGAAGGFGGFGQSTNTGTGATGGGLFGGLGGGTTGGIGTGGGGFSFGQPQQNQQQQQGQQQQQQPATGGGLFGSTLGQGTGGGGLFGGSTFGGGLFGGSTFGQQQQQPLQQQQQQQQTLSTSVDQNPYGTNPLFDTIPTGPAATALGASAAAGASALTKRKPVLSSSVRATPSRPLTRLRGFASPASGVSAAGRGSTTSPVVAARGSPQPLFGSLPSETALSPNAFLPRQSVKKLVLDRKPGEEASILRASVSVTPRGSPAPNGSPIPAAAAGTPKVSFHPHLERAAQDSLRRSPAVGGGSPAATPIRRSATSTSILDGLTTTPSHSPPSFTGKVASQRAGRAPAAAPIRDGEYWSSPSLDELQTMSARELQAVPDFVVGRHGFGEIRFLEPVDLTSVPSLSDFLGTLVVFEPRVAYVYPAAEGEDEAAADAAKPPPGKGLNVPAQISLEKCWPRDKATGEPIRDADHPKMASHVKRLRKVPDTLFKSFDAAEGKWVFEVEGF